MKYAIKINSKMIRSEADKKNALYELYALSALSVTGDNQNVVRYFSGWFEESKLYIVVSFNF
jgi:hypothetical protein